MSTAVTVVLAVVALLACGVAAIVALAASRPSDFRIARKTVVRALVTDFHRWTAWSPWEGLDPDMRRGYEGAAEGVGAVYTWAGNAKVGKGRMEITAATPASVVIDPRFEAPFQANNVTELTFTPSGEGTEVEWSMRGRSAFVHKIFGLFMDMDALVGKDFEKGLTQLKAASEA